MKNELPTLRVVCKVLRTKELRLKLKVKELRKVINRIGTIQSEIFGAYDGQYETELNHLIMKKTLKKFDYSDSCDLD